jgi:hypothetical protein
MGVDGAICDRGVEAVATRIDEAGDGYLLAKWSICD